MNGYDGYVKKTKQSTGPMSPGLTHALAHRIDQQIARVYRRTYNAETGLKTLVRLAVLEMMQGGSTPEQMRFAFVARVEDQAGAGKDSLVSGGSHASDISKRVIGWCDDMHAELSAVEVFGVRGAQ